MAVSGQVEHPFYGVRPDFDVLYFGMPIHPLADLPPLLARGSCLLGLDYGSKHIGVAISDPGLCVASPLCTIERTTFARVLDKIRQIMAARTIGGFVIGLPLQLDGSTGPAAQAARTFARNLDQALGLPLALWDERFSTAVIQRDLTERADLSRAKRAAIVDKLAASYILQGALDYLRNRTP